MWHTYILDWLNDSLTHWLTDWLTHSLTQPLTHPLTHSPTHPPTHPLTHSPTHSLTHSPTHPLTHSPRNLAVFERQYLLAYCTHKAKKACRSFTGSLIATWSQFVSSMLLSARKAVCKYAKMQTMTSACIPQTLSYFLGWSLYLGLGSVYMEGGCHGEPGYPSNRATPKKANFSYVSSETAPKRLPARQGSPPTRGTLSTCPRQLARRGSFLPCKRFEPGYVS